MNWNKQKTDREEETVYNDILLILKGKWNDENFTRYLHTQNTIRKYLYATEWPEMNLKSLIRNRSTGNNCNSKYVMLR